MAIVARSSRVSRTVRADLRGAVEAVETAASGRKSLFPKRNIFSCRLEQAQEIAAVARAKNVAINPGLVQAKLDIAAGYPPNLYASMYHDLTAGKKIEVEGIFGYVANDY